MVAFVVWVCVLCWRVTHRQPSIGGIAGGGKGAAIGSIVGGTGAVVGTRGKEVRLAAGETVTTKLRAPVTILVAVGKK